MAVAYSVTGHSLTGRLVRRCVNGTQGYVLLTSRTRGVRKRDKVKGARKVLIKGKSRTVFNKVKLPNKPSLS